MNLNKHSNLKGQHAIFSPSKSSWIRYDREKIIDRIINQYRAPLGTEIHEFSAIQIELNNRVTNIKSLKQSIATFIFTKYQTKDPSYKEYAIRLINYMGFLSNDVFETVKQYINDAIGYKMLPEQVLYYSDEIFGTADTIFFRNNHLRIHDLKTGENEPDMEQLLVYASIFCLENDINPNDISIELRLYHWSGIIVYEPTIADLLPIIDQIKNIANISKEVKEEDNKQ